jgi:hypothetical protein
MGYLDFLDLVLEEEHAIREERRIRHALRISKGGGSGIRQKGAVG